MDFENPFGNITGENQKTEEGKVQQDYEVIRKNSNSANGELNEKYEELKSRLEKEIPNYERFLPEYKIVKEIPDIKQREEGIKYFNDQEVMERVRRDDLIRVLHGENLKSTADIAVTRYTEEELKQKIREELYQDRAYIESIPPEFKNIIDDYIDGEAEDLLRQLRGHGRVAIFDASNNEIMYFPDKIADIGTHSHEETHGFLEKYIKKQIPRDNKDFIAVNEGLAFAVEKFYSGAGVDDDALLYLGRANPYDTEKAQNLAMRMISIIGPYSTKKFVVNVINEAYEKKVDVIELLEEKVSNYVDNNADKKASLSILSEINEDYKDDQ